jgi:hypothetical protein
LAPDELLLLELLLDDLAPDELLLVLELLEPDELLELEPPELELLGEAPAAARATATVAELGEPKFTAPATDVSETLNPLPAAPGEIGTRMVRDDVSPAAHVSVPDTAE